VAFIPHHAQPINGDNTHTKILSADLDQKDAAAVADRQINAED
jgi:hypothetical protein